MLQRGFNTEYVMETITFSFTKMHESIFKQVTIIEALHFAPP